MSRAALWAQEGKAKEREEQALEAFRNAVEEGKNNRSRGLVPMFGSEDTFNMNPMLLRNITKSSYFTKLCREVNDWTTLVDEIYYHVKHVEPWSDGAAKQPSTAFCLLLRLLCLRCTEKQMTLLLEHVDSPYIRCIGFLYLRYVCDPSRLFDFVQPYLYDEEPVQATARGPETTVGQFVRKLLTEMNYHGTLLPRLPVQMERDIKVKLLQAEHMEERAQRHLASPRTMEHFQRLGSRVRALYGDEENPVTWYDAVVDRVMLKNQETGEPLARPKFVVTFPEYGNTETVTLGEMDMIGGGNDQGPSRGMGGDRREKEGRGRSDHGRGYDRYDQDRGRGYDRGGARYNDGKRQDRWERDRHRDNSSRGGAVPSEQDLLEQVLRQEREKSTAKGKAYAARPMSTKASLAVERDPHARNHAPPPLPEKRHDSGGGRSSTAQASPDKPGVAVAPEAKKRPKTAEELAAINVKKRKLLAKYG